MALAPELKDYRGQGQKEEAQWVVSAADRLVTGGGLSRAGMAQVVGSGRIWDILNVDLM